MVERYGVGAPGGEPTRVKQPNTDGRYSLVNAPPLPLAVIKPDGTQQVYSSPVNDGPGLYHQDMPAADLTQIGHYQLFWTATGTGAGVQPGDFDVADPAEVALLPLQDAKDQLNIGQTETRYDSELQMFIATFESSLEDYIAGPAVNRTIPPQPTATISYQTAIP